jgi:hypothetical protein
MSQVLHSSQKEIGYEEVWVGIGAAVERHLDHPGAESAQLRAKRASQG